MDRESDSPADAEPVTDPDLDLVERDLEDVETALERLEAGTYWTDEVTGEPLPDALLDEHPVTSRHDQ